MVAWVAGYLYPKAYRLLPTVVKRSSASVTEMDGWRFGGGPGGVGPIRLRPHGGRRLRHYFFLSLIAAPGRCIGWA